MCTGSNPNLSYRKPTSFPVDSAILFGYIKFPGVTDTGPHPGESKVGEMAPPVYSVASNSKIIITISNIPLHIFILA